MSFALVNVHNDCNINPRLINYNNRIENKKTIDVAKIDRIRWEVKNLNTLYRLMILKI